MISVAEARALILSAARSVGIEHVALRAAHGRTLREDIIATRAQPPFRASAMDGFAMRACDTPGVLRMSGESCAGRGAERRLARGECTRIFTGAPLPEGADTVLPQEDAAQDGDLIHTPKLEAGRHVRAAGVDFNAGDLLLQSGRLLTPAAIALAAAAGLPSLAVSTAPRVAVLSGGDELIAPGRIPAADQIFDSMSYGLAALAESWGASTTGAEPLLDRQGALADAVAEAVSGHDLTIVIGGASVGDHDHARPALRALGAEFLFEKVAVRPGKPTWFARLGDRLVLGLPGNPASAFVCAHLFLRPLLDALCGRTSPSIPVIARGRMRTALAANGPRESYLRASFQTDIDGQSWVSPAADQDSSLLSVFACANALIARPSMAKPARQGDVVEFLRL